MDAIAAVLCFVSMLHGCRVFNPALQHSVTQDMDAVAAVLCFGSMLHCCRGSNPALHQSVTQGRGALAAVLGFGSMLHCCMNSKPDRDLFYCLQQHILRFRTFKCMQQ